METNRLARKRSMPTKLIARFAKGQPVLLNNGTRGIIVKFIPTYTVGRVIRQYILKIDVESFNGERYIMRDEDDIMLDRASTL